MLELGSCALVALPIVALRTCMACSWDGGAHRDEYVRGVQSMLARVESGAFTDTMEQQGIDKLSQAWSQCCKPLPMQLAPKSRLSG